MSLRPNMSVGKSPALRRCAVQPWRKPAQYGERPTRWVRWVALILNILVKFCPAETAVLRQILPSKTTRRVGGMLRRRLQSCLRYIDCTRNPVARRRMRRRA